jgi:hypothetical protein
MAAAAKSKELTLNILADETTTKLSKSTIICNALDPIYVKGKSGKHLKVQVTYSFSI